MLAFRYNNLKEFGLSLLEWFQQLTTYQKLITYISAITGSLIIRYGYCKLHRKFYNYPPGIIGWPIFGYALSFQPGKTKFWETVANDGDNNEGVTLCYVFGRIYVCKVFVFASKYQTANHGF